VVEGAASGGNLAQLLASMHNAAVDSSLERSTKSTGDSSVRAWSRFCDNGGANIFCMRGDDPYPLVETIYLILAFAAFEATRGIAPQSTFTVYLPAVKNFFTRSFVFNNFSEALSSNQVKFARRGYTKIYCLMHPKSESRKMAFTIELVNFVHKAFKEIDMKFADKWFIAARDLALRTGIYFLLRKSEYLPNRKGDSHGILRSDILFFDREGFPVTCSSIHTGQAGSARISIPYSKCDQFGKGRNILHVRQEKDARCIVNDLEEWIIRTRIELGATNDDYLFRIKDRNIISSEQVSIIMKRTAEFCGFASEKISAHSLRYGGATMLAAAGLPQYIIAYFGGWCEDSKSLQTYTQLNVSSNNMVSKIFSDGDRASLEETRIRHTLYANR